MKPALNLSLLLLALPVALNWALTGVEAAECDGVAWPAEYRPVANPPQLPSDRLAPTRALEFPVTRLPEIDTQTLLEEDNARLGSHLRMRVGVNRALVEPLTGQWHDVPAGGRLWTAAIVSEGAAELRLHFSDVDLPPGAEVYVYSPEDPHGAAGPYTTTGPRSSGEFWSAPVAGDTAYLEYYVPDGKVAALAFSIRELGHTYRQLDQDDPGGARGPLDCMGDVACYSAWEDISYSVARLQFYSDDPPDPPGWYNCTGQLLASQNADLTPYFLTSAHCLDEQSEGETLQCRWFYQRATCGGSLMSSQYGYDADVLGTSGSGSGADWSLLMVKGVLPAGVYWSGWMTSNPASGTWSVGVHHPDGSWKRYSRGLRYAGPWSNYHQIRFNVTGGVGHIYYGSSGSGMWRESDQKLFGNSSFVTGEPGCDHMDTYAYYGRFANYYSSIASLLTGGSDDAFEDNDACADATALDSGAYNNLVVKSVAEDWYRITVGNAEQLELDLTFSDSHGNIDLELYDTCGGAVVAEAKSFSNNESLTYVNSGTEANYYLRAYLHDDTRNTYDLEFVLTTDQTPPLPDPMTFSTPPYATGPNSIAMTAALATDPFTPPVEYYFEFVSGGAGGDDSGWQVEREYTDVGLEAYTNYCYQVKARDSASEPNETRPSDEECTDTPPDPALVNPPAPATSYPHDARKNRYLSFDPNNTQPVALRVDLTASLDFPDSTGVLGWVGEPDENGIARLVDEPFPSDAWPDVVHLGDCAIVPAATYETRATLDAVTFTDPLALSTTARPVPKYWGDCVGALEGDAWTGPNGVVNMDDVVAAVQKFKVDPNAPHLTWVDVNEEIPDKVLNFGDIQMIVNGFKGQPYPFSNPAECP